MVFKARFFSSKKSAGTSSPDGPAGSPSSSPRSDKKKPKSPSSSSSAAGTPRHSPLGDAVEQRQKPPTQQQSTVKKDKDRASTGKDASSTAAPSFSAPAKLNKAKAKAAASSTKDGAQASLPPLLASSLGLNRIKTRSGPLPQEGLRADNRMSGLGSSNLSRGADSGSAAFSSSSSAGRSSESSMGKGLDKVPDWCVSSWSELGAKGRCVAASAEGSLGYQNRSGESSAAVQTGRNKLSLDQLEATKSSTIFSSEMQSPYDVCRTPKESESPRFKEIMQATSAPRKRFPGDIKSFSHELNSKGVWPFPFSKPKSMYNLKEVLKVIQVKFEKAKEEVNVDLEIFAGDLVGVMEKYSETHPLWNETLEDLLILARSCCVMAPGEFWLQCEGIVQDLDDRRQELPMGVLKKLYTRMLFILTRCTRLLQFHKESGFAEDEVAIDRGYKNIQSSERDLPERSERNSRSNKDSKSSNEASSRKTRSQEQHNLKWKRSQELEPVDFFSQLDANSAKDMALPASRERISSWKALPSPVEISHHEPVSSLDEVSKRKADALSSFKKDELSNARLIESSSPEAAVLVDSVTHTSTSSKHQHRVSWGYWADQQSISGEGSIMCRICEEYVPTLFVEIHLKICAVADSCDKKGLSVDDRLVRIAETLEKMIESYSQKDHNVVGSPDISKVSNSSVTEESDILSPKLSDWSRHGSADMLDCFHEADHSIFLDDLKNLPTVTCKTRFGPKSDQGMTTSSAGSLTPRSPLMTPRANHIDALLAGRSAVSESEDLPQINELADIAKCIANAPIDEERSSSYLVSCLEDLQEVMSRRKLEALTVQTFGTRIEKLHREKYLQLCDSVASLDTEKVDTTSTIMDEEEDVVRSLRSSPVHLVIKDRTSIDDFEIIKPISRGAFGRVFLAKKRTTGDLFAIKVLKKADMIRKNAVESILAERDILITARNPFVVRFFYSFTSRENLYLVMEYLNGGDLYSLLRNLGCLDEDVVRVYIAELVLALEYLHSLRVVHRDLKPDNLLIAHDGHIKLTDFGISKVGLINSTDDLSTPAVSGASFYGEDEPQVSPFENLSNQERWKNRSAVGTPDYLAPEILLGTGHGASADWWSVGIILFELIVGIPPFNATLPQIIFDNILNRKIPWPRVPEEMSYEAQDLIDKLLTEDPHQRLGAKGASEVKQHVLFTGINWDTLARQKAAFVPSSDSALDTSYFTSRYSWRLSDEEIHEASEFENSSENGSESGSSSGLSNYHEETGDDNGGHANLKSGASVNYSFSNFSFKNLIELASINYDLLSMSSKEDQPPASGT